MLVYKYISQLANGQRRLIDSLATNKAYSGAQGKVIHYLFNNKGKTVYQKEIEKSFGLRASTATELIKSLEKMGVIKRVPSKEDARFKEIILTEKADEYKEDVRHDMEMLEEKLTSKISKEELNYWVVITNKMLANLGGMGNEK
jgi:DNA-binding MarR family transcriptional regulator